MADIELVIKIPEEAYKLIMEFGFLEHTHGKICYKAIKNGTLLPKGHGRLIDVGQCNRKLFYHQCGGANSLITVKSAFDMLMSLSTIIEEDTESEDKERG